MRSVADIDSETVYALLPIVYYPAEYSNTAFIAYRNASVPSDRNSENLLSDLCLCYCWLRLHWINIVSLPACDILTAFHASIIRLLLNLAYLFVPTSTRQLKYIMYSSDNGCTVRVLFSE